MEYLRKPKQKLSLSSTFNRLHTTLWQQKQKNHFFEKQNVILNTKINSIKQNFNFKGSNLQDDCTEEKLQLRQLYALIKQQQQWIKQTTSMIEEKNFDREYKSKVRVEKKLHKTNKKCKELTKKLHKIQDKIDFEQKNQNTSKRFLGYHEDNQNKKEIEPGDVLAELQKENQQLTSLYKFKDRELANQNRKIKCINNEIIDLLALKNWLRKFVTQSQKVVNSQKIKNKQFYNRPNTSEKTQSKNINIQKTSHSTLNKSGPSSMFRQVPKLKITTQ